jgi:outer membrane protein TolC
MLLGAWLTASCLMGRLALPVAAQEARLPAVLPANVPPATVRITLDEAKQRALSNSKLLDLANLNAQSKAFAVRAAQSDYFPKVVGTAMYLHFNDELGKVLTTPGRVISGPRGRPLMTFPPATFEVPVYNQDSSLVNIGALQPLTDLLKVRQGVAIARADEGIARAQLEKDIRELVSGVEQLYWGLLAAQRIRAGAQQGVRDAELLAKTQTVEARTALVEAQQGLQQVEKQIADLREQLNGLLNLPLCTVLELVEPALPVLPYHCADEVVGVVLASSPDIQEARETVRKAEAALAAGRLDFIPSIALMGGYVNQTVQSYVQQDIGYIGVVGTYTFFDGGKRRNVIRERQNLVAMANLKLQQTEADVQQKTVKAFRDWTASQEALKTAQELAGLQAQAEKSATTPPGLMVAAKARMLADVDLVKADLGYRQAYVQLMSLIGGS